VNAPALLVLGLACLFAAGCEQPYRVFAVQVAAAPNGPAGMATAPVGLKGKTGTLEGERGLAGRRTQWDLNEAGVATLGTLPGITPALVGAMIAGRPYRAKRELLTRRILTTSEYGRWKAYLVVHHGQNR